MRSQQWKASLLALTVFVAAYPAAAQTPVDVPESIVGTSMLPEAQIQERLDEALYDWQTFDLPLPDVAAMARESGRISLKFGAHQFDLELEPVDLRAEGYRAVWAGQKLLTEKSSSPLGTYRGQVKNQPGSDVRLLILPDLLQGHVRTDEGWFFIEPLLKFASGEPPAEVVLFEEGDVRESGRHLCGSGPLEHVLDRYEIDPDDLATSGLVTKTGTSFTADVATEADFEYFQVFGANTNSQIANVLNQVNGIYQDQVNLTLRLAFQHVWTTVNDPYTQTDPNGLLNQFRTHWSGNFGHVNRDLTHLFTGKDLNGTTIGIAFVGVVCNDPSWSYGLSENFFLMVKLAAHEIGHNFNGRHDDELNPPAATCTGSGPIMCSALQTNGPETFSFRSKNDINNHISSRGSCLSVTSGPVGTPSSISIQSERCRGLHTVVWATSSGATYYELYKSTSVHFYSQTLVYSGSATSRWGSQSGLYYRVRACNASGCSGYRATTSPTRYYSGCA